MFNVDQSVHSSCWLNKVISLPALFYFIEFLIIWIRFQMQSAQLIRVGLYYLIHSYALSDLNYAIVRHFKSDSVSYNSQESVFSLHRQRYKIRNVILFLYERTTFFKNISSTVFLVNLKTVQYCSRHFENNLTAVIQRIFSKQNLSRT